MSNDKPKDSENFIMDEIDFEGPLNETTDKFINMYKKQIVVDFEGAIASGVVSEDGSIMNKEALI